LPAKLAHEACARVAAVAGAAKQGTGYSIEARVAGARVILGSANEIAGLADTLHMLKATATGAAADPKH